jgi:hypothetical protein
MLYRNLFGLAILAVFVSQAVYAAGPAAVNLGSAGSFAILSKSGISTTGTTSIVGNIGVSPAAATYITGFGLILDSSTQFSTSSLVTGKVYAADYAAPTPTMMTTAIGDMQTAYTDAAGRTNPSNTELGAGNIGGMTLSPGLYKWSTGLTIPASGVTLNCNGNSSSVFIFQIAQTLTVGNGAIVTLSGGCQPQNIFWQVGGQATLGTTSNFKGVILSQTAIVIGTGATLSGEALAQTAVTLNADAVTKSTGSATTTSTTTAPTTTVAASTLATTSIGSSGSTASTTSIGAGGSSASTTSSYSTTIGYATTVAPTTSIPMSTATTTIYQNSGPTSNPSTTGVSGFFIWAGSGYYEIPASYGYIPATGMRPGVSYYITNPLFAPYINAWLSMVG